MSAVVAAAAATAKEEGAQAERPGVEAFVTVFDTLHCFWTAPPAKIIY